MFLMKVILGLTIALLAVFQGQCSIPSARLRCSADAVFLLPGTCVAFSNPCPRDPDTPVWVTGDTIRIDDGTTPPGVTIELDRSQRIPTREICAALNTQPVVNHQIKYDYTRAEQRGEGVIDLTVPAGTALAATASANPATIDAGGTSQLSVNLTGGNAPYSYAWGPVSSLNAGNIANPVASPTITTIYDLTVTDSANSSVTARVIVNVRFTVRTTVSPATINPGESSLLNANASGGTPPYTYAWSPSSTLSSSDDFNPIATPTSTTTYTVTVTDQAGDQLTDSVTVTVNAPTPTPTPTGADLAVTISDSADPVARAGPLTLTFVVTNNGPLTATNVRLSYPLPMGTLGTVELASNFFPSQGTCSLSLNNILTCNFGTLASGNSATLPLPVFMLSPGLMTSTATVIANESDPNPSNNTDTETTTVTP